MKVQGTSLLPVCPVFVQWKILLNERKRGLFDPTSPLATRQNDDDHDVHHGKTDQRSPFIPFSTIKAVIPRDFYTHHTHIIHTNTR